MSAHFTPSRRHSWNGGRTCPDPDQFRRQADHAHQVVRQRKDPQAETAFKKAIELDNLLLSAYMNLGQVYLTAGKTDQAVKEYEAVLAKNPKVLQAHMLLGIIHEGRKEYDKAA